MYNLYISEVFSCIDFDQCSVKHFKFEKSTVKVVKLKFEKEEIDLKRAFNRLLLDLIIFIFLIFMKNMFYL